MAKAPRIIWQLTDGKAGHDEQTTGLVSAISKLISVDLVHIEVSQKKAKSVLNALRGRFPEGHFLPLPDMIVGAGSNCIFPLIAARREYGGRSIYLMNSGLPPRFFDLNLIPRHDKVPDGPHCITTEGPINSIQKNGPKRNNSGLILVGGTSKHYKWDQENLLGQIGSLINKTNTVNWTIVTSRRTPSNSTSALSNIALAFEKPFHSFDKCKPGWLRERLIETEQVWVTSDSLSMIYEALTAGCTVGILDIPTRKKTRVTNVPMLLKKRGWVRTIQNPTQSRNTPRLSEANRCAAEIVRMWPELSGEKGC